MYSGRWKGLEVAVKIVNAKGLDTYADFKKEFDMLLLVESSYTPKLYGVTETRSKLAMVMELCANGSLTKVLQTEALQV